VTRPIEDVFSFGQPETTLGNLQSDSRASEVYGCHKEARRIMPDKSPRKPSAKKPADKSLKEKRQDKKDKKAGNSVFGGLPPRV
jgi:hypothetical protein